MTRGATRLTYLDRARGLAVLLMMEAHTLDAWTRPADRGSAAYGVLTVLGGFAAPLFLWLAGTSAALSASRTAARSGRAAAVEAVCRRGLEIFILAFLFRLQAFVASPGGPAIGLFRVDILNVMGPALVAAALIWGATRSAAGRCAAFCTIAVATAMATPMVRNAAAVDALPTWLQWYVRPAGEHTTFTLLPWAGFVFGGGAAGVLIAAVAQSHPSALPAVPSALRSLPFRLHAWLSAVGAGLIAIGIYTATRPALFAHANFWTSSPTFFAVRAGVVLLVVSAFAFADRLADAAAAVRQRRWLTTLGRSSLFVYWIHVELVYGYATWPIHRALPVWAAMAACAAFAALMYRAVLLRDAVVTAWKNRRAGGQLQTA